MKIYKLIYKLFNQYINKLLIHLLIYQNKKIILSMYFLFFLQHIHLNIVYCDYKNTT